MHQILNLTIRKIIHCSCPGDDFIFKSACGQIHDVKNLESVQILFMQHVFVDFNYVWDPLHVL